MLQVVAMLALSMSVRSPPVHRGHSRFFLDTADVAEWAELLPLGLFHGVTTNPVLLQRAGVPCTVPSCRALAEEAFGLGAGEVMLQAWGESAAALVASGLALSEGDCDRIVVKVPVTAPGTQAAAALIERGVRVCLTACYGSHQALVAAAAGAEYLAPYLGRMTDAGKAGHEEIEAMQSIVDGLGSSTRIFAASIRHVDDLSRLATAGVYTFTFSPDVARMLFEIEPLTDAAAADFERAALQQVPPGWVRFDPKPVTEGGGLFDGDGDATPGRWLSPDADAMAGGRSGGPTPPSAEEMNPGHPAMIARAAIAKMYHSERVLSPADAAALIEAEEAAGNAVELIDVRTDEQREAHEINGVAGVGVCGATPVSLDAMVGGTAYLPDDDATIILACSEGPKSLVALDFLYDRFERVYCIDGGLAAWDAAGLPTERLRAEEEEEE